jgi:transposase
MICHYFLGGAMTDILNVINERIDDVPLIIEVCKQLNLDKIVEKHLKTHGLQQGIPNGALAVGWLSYIISQADHRMNAVRDWANKIPLTLASLLGTPIRNVEFSDDRLCNLLDRFSDDNAWKELEADLWKNSLEVFDLQRNVLRFDGTAACGYHDISENGLMQFGASKDHRPDLPQLKIMAASIDPGIIVGMDIASGETNDDVMYVPLIQRVHSMMNAPGSLYVGDCKMGAINTRATIHLNNDYYLMPLGMQTQKIRQYFDELVEEIVNGDQPAELIYNTNNKYIVSGYETSRDQEYTLNGTKILWKERLFVYRSQAFAENEIRIFEKNICKAEQALWKLTPDPGRGKRQITDENQLQQSIQGIIENNQMQGLLQVHYEKCNHREKDRYVILSVCRNTEEIGKRKSKLGWRLMATNAPQQNLSFCQAQLTYRDEWRLENNYKILKKSHLGISPLFVRKDERLKGLCRLLSIALRLIALIQYRIRESLATSKEVIKGLEKGKPNSTTSEPTTLSILQKFASEQITISKVILFDKIHYHATPLSEELKKILIHLKIPLSVYEVALYARI